MTSDSDNTAHLLVFGLEAPRKTELLGAVVGQTLSARLYAGAVSQIDSGLAMW